MLTPSAAIEALLFASGEPLEKKRLAALLSIREAELGEALKALAGELAGRGITMVESEREVELRASAAAADLIKQLRESELTRDLGRASLEALAVVAYRDGATRGEIDWVRGVNSSASVRTLLLRGLIEGAEDPRDKRRIRYTMTTDALAHLGLANAHELPRYDELAGNAERALGEEEARASAAASG